MTNAPLPANPQATTEGSLMGRFVALLSPLFVIAAGWLAGEVAKVVPGAKLDKTQIVSFMIAASVSALTAAWKWLQGWQQHEQLVAQGLVEPRKAAPPRKPAPEAPAPTALAPPPPAPAFPGAGAAPGWGPDQGGL